MDRDTLSVPEVRIGPGSVQHVPALLERLDTSRVLLVTGGSSYTRSGASECIEPALAGLDVARIEAEEDNPTFAEVAKGLERIERFFAGTAEPSVVLAVGGGKAMDLAKLLMCARAQPAPLLELARAKTELRSVRAPLIAVPTTAGTGSEATHFATVFEGTTKYSVAHASLKPGYAIVDPALCASMPPRVTASTGLDALCQAIESSWAVGATKRSRADALRAMKLVCDHLEDAVHRPAPEPRAAMSEAAYLAGRAIDISRTTASHALSYAITIRWSVPHGHAVALTLPALIRFNALVTTDDVLDPRGAEYVTACLADVVTAMGAGSVEDAATKLEQLVAEVGLGPRLHDVGIQTQEQRDWVAEQVNPERLANNPRRLSQSDLAALLVSTATR
jgi:alcohol dehydrogenase class IV